MNSQSNRSGILACGNFVVDHVKEIDAWPTEESLAIILDTQKGNGGGPYNLLKDLHNLGADYPLEACGSIGKDAYGDFILQDLESNGIDMSRVSQSSRVNTAFTDVMADRGSNRRTFFYHPGANARFKLDHQSWTNSNSKILYYGYIGLLPEMDKVNDDGVAAFCAPLQEAKESGFITVADAVSIPNRDFGKLIQSALSCLDYLFMNDHELQLATGAGIRREDQSLDIERLENSALKLLKGHQSRVLVVHFPEGAIALRRDGILHRQGSLQVDDQAIRGAVGAGDAFCAGFLNAMHQNKPLPECMELAVCCAAACLTHPTASGGVKSEKNCRQLSTTWSPRNLS